uniref:Si:dkey-219c10.4 n=1 Tax=Electrophorus electricus TaxID=8005 RepID=A0A4W4FHC4_ELEEL
MSKTDDMDLLIMLTSAVCHDLDHRGYNSAYQINGRTELALRYNDISPLENHHCAVAFEILEKTESNIFRNLTTEQYKRRRERIIKCILATDMSRHTEILNKFKTILPMFDFSAKYHRDVVPGWTWLDLWLDDMEKLGLPVTPFMDRHKVTKPSSQTAFICFVLFPRFIELTNLFPCLEVRMSMGTIKEKYNRTQSEKTAKPKEGAMTKESEVSLEPGPAVKPSTL